MHRLAALIAVLTLATAVGCGSDTKTVADKGPNGQTVTREVPDIKFAKTKFLLHAGLAAGAFHRYIYKPYRQGSFRRGAPGRKKAIAKAGAAGLFAAHELKVARKDALASDTLRRRVVNPLDRVAGRFTNLGGALKGGRVDAAALQGASRALETLRSRSGQAGAPIKDAPAPNIGG